MRNSFNTFSNYNKKEMLEFQEISEFNKVLIKLIKEFTYEVTWT